MKTLYIGHPLMGSTPEAHKQGWGDPEKNVERYLRFTAWASNNGYAVISWVHHYLMHTRGLTRGDADFYLSRDKLMLKSVDFFWECGPVEVSSGLLFEVEACKEFGIPIIRDVHWDDPKFMPNPSLPLSPNVIAMVRLHQLDGDPEQRISTLFGEGHQTIPLLWAAMHHWNLSLPEARDLVEPRIVRR